MKRTLLPMTLAALFALTLSACSTTMNSAATRTASSPLHGTANTYEDRHSVRTEQRAVSERPAKTSDDARVVHVTASATEQN